MVRSTDAAVAAGDFAISVAATWLVGLQTHASLVALMIPFCMMAVVNGGIYPIVVAQALKPFPQATGRAAARKIPCSLACAS